MSKFRYLSREKSHAESIRRMFINYSATDGGGGFIEGETKLVKTST